MIHSKLRTDNNDDSPSDVSTFIEEMVEPSKTYIGSSKTLTCLRPIFAVISSVVTIINDGISIKLGGGGISLSPHGSENITLTCSTLQCGVSNGYSEINLV
ncbi:hypothetical protein ACTA71_007049 [Dictyostelium dimigraforme]